MSQKHTETKPQAAPVVPDKKMVKQNLRYLRDKYREKVKGIFRFHEVPGGSMSFCYKEFKEDEVERYDFIDGQMYTIPLGVAKHLNTNCWYPLHAYQQDENGVAVARIGQKVRRCSFQSLEFMDIDELNVLNNQLVTVEYSGVL